MDRKKPREHRLNRRVARKRIWLASLLNSNLLKLGAGVSVSVASCGIANAEDAPGQRQSQQVTDSIVRSNPFVTPTVLPPSLFAAVPAADGKVMQTSDLQLSELRLKSIGTAVGLVPIGQPRNVVPTIEISQPQASKIRVNPMAGGSSELLDQPVLSMEDVESETPALHFNGTPPRILSLHRKDTNTRVEPVTTGEPPSVFANQVDVVNETVQRIDSQPQLSDLQPSEPQRSEPQSPPSESNSPPQLVDAEQIEMPIAAPETLASAASDLSDNTEHGVSFSFSDWAGDASEVAVTADEEEFVIPPPPRDTTPSKTASAPVTDQYESAKEELQQLPLLPIPHHQWVAQQPAESLANKYPQRHRQHVEVAAPPMIAAARMERPGAVSATPIIPAKLARFLRPTSQVPAEPVAKPAELDPMVQLVKDIRDNHSTARVSLAEENKRLVVRGVCRSREQATDVIRLIRSRFLIPVDDQLVIR